MEDYFPCEDFYDMSSFSFSSPGFEECMPPPPMISTGHSFPPDSYNQSVFSQSIEDQYVQPPNASLPLPAFSPTPSWGMTQDSLSTPNPCLPFDGNPLDVQSPDLQPPPFAIQFSEESPDLESPDPESPDRESPDRESPDRKSPHRKGPIRFGKPQKRPPERYRQQGHRSVMPQGPTNRKLNVGLPSSTVQGGRARGLDGMKMWMTRRPAGRALSLTTVVIIIIVVAAVWSCVQGSC